MNRTAFIAIVVIGIPLVAHAASHNIAEVGAVADGRTVNTTAIQRAIDRCRDAGGGTVVVPAGTFVTGTLRLHSNLELHLEPGAVLRGSTNLADYQLNGRRVGLLYTEDAGHVAITGPGNIDGNGDAFMVLDRAKKMPPLATQYTRQQGGFRNVTSGLGDGPLVPHEQRPFQMIIFSNCRDVTIRDALITNSPFWTVHFADCDGVIVRGVRLWNNVMVPNGDGIDFTSCSNVLVSDCDIRAGDDALVFGGYDHHFDLPGFNGITDDSENIVVTNCTLLSRSSAIRIGGADQNSMRRYVFSNLVIHDSNRGIGLFVREQGSIEDVTFTNIVIETRLHTGDWWGNGEPIHLSAVRNMVGAEIGRMKNIKFSHIIARGESGIVIQGTPESVITDVSFHDVSLEIRPGPLSASSGGNFDFRPVLDPKLALFRHDIPAIHAEHVRDLAFSNVEVGWGDVRGDFYTEALAIAHFENVRVDGFRGAAAPAKKTAAAIALRDGRGYEITNSRPHDRAAQLLATERVEVE